jgi:hypothetical protein
MITAIHKNGKVVITTAGRDEFGDPGTIDQHLDLEAAQNLFGELRDALYECRGHAWEKSP